MGWFGSKEVDALADSVVADLRALVPVTGVEDPSPKAFRKLQKRLGTVFARVDAFVSARDPGIYAKARFGNRVQWALKEAGYPPQFIEQVMKELLLHAAAGRASR